MIKLRSRSGQYNFNRVSGKMNKATGDGMGYQESLPPEAPPQPSPQGEGAGTSLLFRFFMFVLFIFCEFTYLRQCRKGQKKEFGVPKVRSA